ncbi:MAG: CoA transferase [OM182 bacterium]|nr:MAG: CoA transferase [OM182 bacterium]
MTTATPLAGLTVLDFGQVYNGPYCGFLLAQAGARVIKVESPTGESLRGRSGTAKPGFPFRMFNSAKECITANIKHPDGRQLIKDLVPQVDVVLENFSPGTLADNGLGSDVLCELNPRLIYAAGTGYGGSGPYRDYLGMDITLQAMSGVMSVTGDADSPPTKAGAAFCDILGGAHLYAGIVSALYQREQTGKGAVIDISMQDCVFPTLATQFGTYFQLGYQPTRTGNRHSGMALAPYNVYQAKDGHVAMICFRGEHWLRLCDAMERPELKTDERFARTKDRARNMDEVDALVEAWTRTLTKAEIFAIAQSAGMICAPVQTLEDVVNDPQLLARGTLAWAEDKWGEQSLKFHTPIRFKGMQTPGVPDMPSLGAHSESVLLEFLGMDADEVARLRNAQAI